MWDLLLGALIMGVGIVLIVFGFRLLGRTRRITAALRYVESLSRQRAPPPRAAPSLPPLHQVLSADEFQQFMRGAPKHTVHRDLDTWGMPRMLFRVPMRYEEDVHAVQVHDATLGTGYYLRCSPRPRTAKAAVAETFGMTEEEYDLAMET
jgi:hypothetical protein